MSLDAVAAKFAGMQIISPEDQKKATFLKLLDYVDASIQRDPNNKGSLCSRADILITLERSLEAIADMNRALTLVPHEASVFAQMLALRGCALRIVGRFQEASNDIKMALQANPGNQLASCEFQILTRMR